MKLGSEWENFAATPHDYAANENQVVALGEYSGTCRATGKGLRVPFAHAWTIRGGKVTAFRQYTDTALWQRAMNETSSRAPDTEQNASHILP